MKEEYLEPSISGPQKSFYHKAIVKTDGTNVGLLSYGTLVCWTGPDLSLHRTWDGWSYTTGRHVTAFCERFGIPYSGKRDWDKLPAEDFPAWMGGENV